MDCQYITIGIPVYNVENFIERCAISLFEQTYKYIRYIFVDDCGKDNSINILRNVVERYPERQPMIRIIRHENNKGLAAARNTIVSNCETSYLIHVDSDDYLDISAVEKCVDRLKEDDYDIVFFSNTVIWSTYKEVLSIPPVCDSRELLKILLTNNHRITVWGALIKTQLYKSNNISAKPGINVGEDLQVMPLLIYRSKLVTSIDDPLYYYDRTNETAYTASFSISKSEQAWESLSLLESQIDDLEVLSWINLLKLNTLIAMIKMNCLANDADINYYKNTLLTRVNDIESVYRRKLSISNRIIVLIQNRFIVRLYLKLINKFRKDNEKN